MQPQCMVVIGNAGSGKSTLARVMANHLGLELLDLDTIAWLADTEPPAMRPLEELRPLLRRLIEGTTGWVAEGCYGDMARTLLEYAEPSKPAWLIWLDPGVGTCQARSRHREWEPQKFASVQAQAEALPGLLDWIAAYDSRNDDLSRTAHACLFERYAGPKLHIRSGDAQEVATKVLNALGEGARDPDNWP